MEEKINNSRIRLGITQGDINGVGYEVILKTFSDSRMFDMCTPILYGSTKVASYHKKLLHLHQDVAFNSITEADKAGDRKFNVVNLTNDEVKIDLGKQTETAGDQSRMSLNRACEDLKKGDIDVLVTAPISKKSIQSSDFDFPGHTEYLSHQFGCSSLMIMVCDRIRIGIVTNHLSIKDVPGAITHNMLFDKIMLMNESLKRDFGVPKPKIAVLALDPHAGDNGVIGTQDATIVKPVIDEVQTKGVLAYGPYPSDGFFGNGDFNKFDGVLALYHDQGLIPFKLMSFTDGVNFTAGLPYVRTSPAHGTAFDIAGRDMASEQSFRRAVYLACDIHRNRKEYDELTADPLV